MAGGGTTMELEDQKASFAAELLLSALGARPALLQHFTSHHSWNYDSHSLLPQEKNGRLSKFQPPRLQPGRADPPQTTSPVPPTPHHPNLHAPPRRTRSTPSQQPQPKSKWNTTGEDPSTTNNPRSSPRQRQHPLRPQDNNLPTPNPDKTPIPPHIPNIPFPQIHKPVLNPNRLQPRRQPPILRARSPRARISARASTNPGIQTSGRDGEEAVLW